MITDMNLPEANLTAEDEIRCGKAVEAAIFAQHLLACGDFSRYTKRDLKIVCKAGEQAINTMWRHNLKLVSKAANLAARRYGVAIDDLFQEGNLALHRAIERYDPFRGNRFSTLAWTCVTRHINQWCQAQHGAVPGSLSRVRNHTRLIKAFNELSHSSIPSLRDVVDSAGLSEASTQRVMMHSIPLDEKIHQIPVEDPSVDFNVDFLDLLGKDGKLLAARFGITGPPRTQTELAKELGVSRTSLARMEHRALARARALLSQDFCRENSQTAA